MFSLQKLKPFLLALFLVIGLKFFFYREVENFLGRVCFGEECPSNRGADAMCHNIASSNCQIPQAPLNDCWLNAYQRCVKGCRLTDGRMCDCADQASRQCMGRRCDDPALACYASVHQKCMAGMGFAVDPDRGRGDACM